MPLRDRLWWIYATFAVPSAVATVLVPYMVLQQFLSIDERFQPPPAETYGLVAFLAAALIFLTSILTVSGITGFRRTRRRKATLHGDVSAMPLADLAVDPTRAPDVTANQVDIYWRATTLERFVQAPLHLLLIGVQCIGMLGVFGISAALLLVDLVNPTTVTARDNRLWLGLAFLGLLLVIAVLVLMLVVTARYIPTAFGLRTYGVSARTDGIECRTELGRRMFIPWGEMRLLEIEGSKPNALGLARSVYRVYGVNGVATWRDNPAQYSQFAPDGISPGEVAVRLRALIDLINARTGLHPRTLSKRLQVKTSEGAATNESSSPAGSTATMAPQRVSPWRDTAITVTLALITLAVAVGVMWAPLTTLPILNIVSAAGLLGLALLLVIIAVRTPFIARSTRRELQYAAQSITMPTDYSPDRVYAFRYDLLSPWTRLAFAVLGLLLLVNLLGLLLLPLAPLVITFTGGLAWLFALSPNPFSVVVAVLVGIYGFAGLLLVVLAWQAGGILLRADTTGISMRIGRKTAELPWARLERLAARPRSGASSAFFAIGDAGRTSVIWPLHPKRLRRLPAGSDATLVDSAELMAVAQERTGLIAQADQ